jgi:hypothetical protein
LASIFFFSDFDSLPFLTICAARAFALAIRHWIGPLCGLPKFFGRHFLAGFCG